MTDKYSKILQYFLYALLAVSIVLGIYYMGFTDLEDRNNGMTDTILWYGYILVMVTAAVAIIGSGANLILNPKGAKTVLIGIVGLVVFMGLAYTLAGDSLNATHLAKGYTATDSKWVGTGLFLTYITLGVAVVSIIVTNIINLFK